MAKIVRVGHGDHGIPQDTLQVLVDILNPAEGFFRGTVELPDGLPDAQNALYGPSCGDLVVSEYEVMYRQRSPDRPLSRMVEKPTRPTRLVTLIGINGGEAGVTLFTAYGGPAAEREPGDPGLDTEEARQAAADFWSVHALATG